MTNTQIETLEEKVSQLLKSLGHPTRLEILMAIGEGEACVCHLENLLGLRQAYISQQLMALRDAQALTARQEGRYIFYRLADRRMLEIIQLTGDILGFSASELDARTQREPETRCQCPHCN